MDTQGLQVSLATEINKRYAEYEVKAAAVANSCIDLTNEARAIGILVKEWCREQLTFEFYFKNKSQCDVPFDRLKAFVSIANRLADKAESPEDAKPFIQVDFQAAGLLTMPEQAPQQSIAVTPFVELTNRLGVVREVIKKWTDSAPVASWDDMTREQVKGQLRPLVELYATL
jgi:hypothetical protein